MNKTIEKCNKHKSKGCLLIERGKGDIYHLI